MPRTRKDLQKITLCEYTNQCTQKGTKVCYDCALVYCMNCCISHHTGELLKSHNIQDRTPMIKKSESELLTTRVIKNTISESVDKLRKLNEKTSKSMEKSSWNHSSKMTKQSKLDFGECNACKDHAGTQYCISCTKTYCNQCADTLCTTSITRMHKFNENSQSHLNGRKIAKETTNGHILPRLFSNSSDNDQTVESTTIGNQDELNDSGNIGSILSPPRELATSPLSNLSTENGVWSWWNLPPRSTKSTVSDEPLHWRSTRSASIESKDKDSNALSSSINHSLKSLSLHPSFQPTDNLECLWDSPPSYTRQRSSSDNGRPPQKPSSIREESPFEGPLTSPGFPTGLETSSSSLLKLWNVLKTQGISRHVVVLSSTGTFSRQRIAALKNTLSQFGEIVTAREEHGIDGGILFYTFFKVSSAVGAVQAWARSHESDHRKPLESLDFSRPFEVASDMSCGTIFLQLHGSSMSPQSIREVCAQFGEVSSVLQRDKHAKQFIIEYNDTRVVEDALYRMGQSYTIHGTLLQVKRCHPPILDMNRVKMFQSCFENTLTSQLRTSSANGYDSYNAAHDGCDDNPSQFKLRTNSTASTATSASTSSSQSPLQSYRVDSSLGNRDRSGLPLSKKFSGMGESNPAYPYGGSYPNNGKSMHHSVNEPSNNLWRNGSHTSRSRSTSAHLEQYGAMPTPDRMYRHRPMSSARSASSVCDRFENASVYSVQSAHSVHSAHSVQSAHSVHSLPPNYHPEYLSNSGMGFMRNRSMSVGGGPYPDVSMYQNSRTSSVVSHNGPLSSGRSDKGGEEFSLVLDHVASGLDSRTTLMIRNIPNKYTQLMLLNEINQHHQGLYDFFYLPIDFKNKCNMGYAFINFIEPRSILSFVKDFDNQRWKNFNSEKVCAITYARLQGKADMIGRFQNSSILEMHESYRPIVFYSSGPKKGLPEPFPAIKSQQGVPAHTSYKKHSTSSNHSSHNSSYGSQSYHNGEENGHSRMNYPRSYPNEQMGSSSHRSYSSQSDSGYDRSYHHAPPASNHQSYVYNHFQSQSSLLENSRQIPDIYQHQHYQRSVKAAIPGNMHPPFYPPGLMPKPHSHKSH